MKKYCEYYYTTKCMEEASRNNSTPLKMYAWFIRNKKGEVLQRSTDDSDIWGDRDGLYYVIGEAEADAREAIQDYYV